MQLRSRILAFALTYPESREDHPWGDTVAKVKDKVFAFFGRPEGGIQLSLALKLPQSGVGLLDRGIGEPTGYGLGKSGWVTIQLTRGDEVSYEELCAWIEESWRAVAPKKLVKARETQSAAASSSTAPKTAGHPARPLKPSGRASATRGTSAAGRSSGSRSGKSGPRTKSSKPR
jgi:predicted DNA-binding protein (MmcQ/YjbR family)